MPKFNIYLLNTDEFRLEGSFIMVISWDVCIPSLTGDAARKAYIYLPEDYDQQPDRRYSVMYMFDGQNVFFDSDASYGKSWGMNDYMTCTGKPLIIVAVECNRFGQRFQEYAPVTYENREHGFIKGKGKLYMDWLIRELKPRIDETFRTLPDRDNTILCGSSMGGLMALYGVCCYNKVFRRAACLSPSLWVAPGKLYNLIARAAVRSDTVLYMDCGSLELGNHDGSADALASMGHLLLKKGVLLTFRMVPGGEHSEASWEKQIPMFMECLGL